MPFAVYPALVSGDAVAGYRAKLVDFSHPLFAEANSGDLLRAAREVLRQSLADLDQAGQDWPTPTPVEGLADRQSTEGAVLLLVDVQVEDTPVRVNISIGDRLLRRLDEAAETQNMTRSGYIAAAVRQRLGEAGSTAEAASGSQRLFDEVSELGRRVNEALGPESAFGRTLADLDARALAGLRALADRVAQGSKREGGDPPRSAK